MEDKPKFIIYEGCRYSLREGYYIYTERLHRRIWKDHFGEIPENHHIHHKNGDTGDNRIENLECISKKDHHAMHFSAIRQVEAMHSKKANKKRKITGNLEKTKRKFSKAGKKCWKIRKTIQGCCIICHQFFQTKNYSGTKYCSPLCRSRAQAIRETRRIHCAICRSLFETVDGKTCSQKCKGKLISFTKKGGKNDPFPTINR